MADVSKSSSFDEDPLHAYSGLSLFPRTLKSFSNPLPSPRYPSEDLQQIHAFLESMPFEVQNEHQQQAKAILEDMNAGVKVNPIPKKRERRPGLDRKRKDFSLNFTQSQSAPIPPSFDGSKYPNPEDYFAEYDKFENANREWQKQTGFSVIDTQQNPRSRRPRRPGIPGRERGTYKHTYTDSYFTDSKNLEALEKESSIPSEQSLERTTAAHVTTADREVDDTNLDTDKDLKNILSELLACNQDELEGDGAVKLLEDRLKIKSFDVEKLSIPEFPDVRKMDLKASGRNPSKPKSVLSDIQNMLKGIRRDAVRNYSRSPSPLTKKHFSSPHPPMDQFSFPDVHNLLPGDQQPSKVDVQPLAKELNICSSSSVAKDAGKPTVDIASHFNSSVEKISSEDDCSTHSVDDAITKRNSVTLEVNVDVQAKGKEKDEPMTDSGANRNTDRRENDIGISEATDQFERLAEYSPREARQFTIEEDSIPHQQAASSKSPNRAQEQYNPWDGSFEHAEHIEEQHGEENENRDITSGLQVENAQMARTKPTARKSTGGEAPRKQLVTKKEQTKKRRNNGSSDSNVTKRSKTVHGETGGNEQMETLPHESGAKKQTEKSTYEREEKPKKTLTRESKIFSSRKSLAGAGTKMEGGVRRSTRIKSRPLEYWRGERFLYGRIHESLATIIGIKYGSPADGKGDKPASKVKSFVSDEYKDLLDFAAMH